MSALARVHTAPRLTILAAAASFALSPGVAMAAVGRHTSLSSFQAATRGNLLLEPFNGPDAANLPSVALSGGGFAGAVSAGPFGLLRGAVRGVGSASSGETMRVAFTGRPVSAFGATLFVIDAGFASVAGTVTIQTDTGETMPVSVAAGGTFFGFTASRPFTSLTIEAPAGVATEFIDNAYVGIAASAPEPADQCADAVTISPNTAAQYPFSTANTGATATDIIDTCTGLDTGPDVWLRFLSPLYAGVTISTCGASFDTVLRVFDGCGASGTGAGATQIACNDDFCAGGAGGPVASLVQFRAEAGEDYLVRISGFNLQTGSGVLTFAVVPDCPGDFNRSGARDVTDIFSFLSAWFVGCP